MFFYNKIIIGKQYNKTILINNFGEHEENIEIEVQNVNLWYYPYIS